MASESIFALQAFIEVLWTDYFARMAVKAFHQQILVKATFATLHISALQVFNEVLYTDYFLKDVERRVYAYGVTVSNAR
jgi:hypothetical protein